MHKSLDQKNGIYQSACMFALLSDKEVETGLRRERVNFI